MTNSQNDFERALHQLCFMVRLAHAGVAQMSRPDLIELAEELEKVSGDLERSWVELENAKFLQAQGGQEHV